MKRSVWIILSVVALAGLAAWLIMRSRAETVAVDLIADLPKTVVNLPNREAFSVIDATINGETKRSIFFKGNSRLAWRVTVPNNAWLSVTLGMTEDAWNIEGADGALFRVTVFDDELLTVMVHPQKEMGDRRWQDYLIDLSEYAGETVDLYLKTNGRPGTNNLIGDHCAWGEPRIVTR